MIEGSMMPLATAGVVGSRMAGSRIAGSRMAGSRIGGSRMMAQEWQQDQEW